VVEEQNERLYHVEPRGWPSGCHQVDYHRQKENCGQTLRKSGSMNGGRRIDGLQPASKNELRAARPCGRVLRAFFAVRRIEKRNMDPQNQIKGESMAISVKMQSKTKGTTWQN
jgi:hypothetical protein